MPRRPEDSDNNSITKAARYNWVVVACAGGGENCIDRGEAASLASRVSLLRVGCSIITGERCGLPIDSPDRRADIVFWKVEMSTYSFVEFHNSILRHTLCLGASQE